MISKYSPTEILNEAWEDFKTTHPFKTFTDNDRRLFESGYKTAWLKATNQFFNDIKIYYEQARTNKELNCGIQEETARNN